MSGAVTNRYARALFAAADAEGKAEAVDQALQTVAKALRDAPDFQSLLNHPVLPAEKKTAIVTHIFGDRLGPVLYRFLTLLFIRGRSEYIAEIAAAFHELSNESNGRLEVALESARDLTQDQVDSITSTVGAKLGKRVTAVVRVRPELLAGYKLRIGNRVIDATLKGMLTDFTRKLADSRVSEEGQA